MVVAFSEGWSIRRFPPTMIPDFKITTCGVCGLNVVEAEGRRLPGRIVAVFSPNFL
jgi:hypothetical protein